MDAQERSQADSLIQELESSMQGFDFFAATRLLQYALCECAIGASASLDQEAIRFSQKPTLAFAPGPIASFLGPSSGEPARMEVYFFGLLEPNTPMPLWFVEEAMHPDNDGSIRAFLDIFNHRLISLFFRAWALNQRLVDLESEEEPSFPRRLRSLVGCDGAPRPKASADISDETIYYCGGFAQERRSAEVLERILSDLFVVPVMVESFVGYWLDIPSDEVTRLGDSSVAMGEGCRIGSRIWDCQTKFRLHIGPLSWDEYEYFLPDAIGYQRMRMIVERYIGLEFAWDLRLTLRAEEVPSAKLGSSQCRLGWSSWIESSHTRTQPGVVEFTGRA